MNTLKIPCLVRLNFVPGINCGPVAILGLLPLLGHAQPAEPALWYKQPAPVWTQALPIGNGHMGAMVFGGANRGANNGDQQSAAANRDIAGGGQMRAQDEHLTHHRRLRHAQVAADCGRGPTGDHYAPL